MSGVLMAAAISAGALGVMGFAIVAVLSLRALRRDADFDAELRAAAFAFKIRMRPHAERNAREPLPVRTRDPHQL